MRLVLILVAAAYGAVSGDAQPVITSALPSATIGVPYSVTLTASGATAPFTWSETGLMPPGLNLTASGVILGTPTFTGTYNFVLMVTDSRQLSASKAVAITVSSPTPTSPALAITASALPSGAVGQAYSQMLAASGGEPPYLWTVGNGLPAGLTLEAPTGRISGTPSSAGSYTVTIQVSDSGGNTATAHLTIVIAPPALAITTVAPLFTGTAGVPYSQPFSAAGGTPPYAWSIASGSTGTLVLDAASGNLQGTPQAAATLSFTVQVADANGTRAWQNFSIVIQAPTLVITTGAPLPTAAVGVSYSQRIAASATGGTAPYTWSLSGLAPGLAFDPGSLSLSGAPTKAGAYALGLAVTDSAGMTVSRNLSLTVSPQALTITTDRQMPAASLNAPFSATFTAAGGVPPYVWSAAGLPAGLAIDPASGIVSGTPSAAGIFNPVVISVSDHALNRYADNFSITVSLPSLPAVAISGLPAAAEPAQQYPLQISLASPYPAPISGQAIIAFSPDSGPGDNTIAFASGGTTATFSVPAGALTASSDIPLAIQTGTASGLISISLRFQAGGVDITPPLSPSISTTIARGAPVITATVASRTSNSITIAVTGYSTAREVTQAVFAFSAGSGQTLQSSATSITLDVGNAFSDWFNSSGMGGQFQFTQPFAIQGDPAAVIPTSVTLKNRIGSETAEINP